MRGLVSISRSMLIDDVWNGPFEGSDSIITILSDVERIIFPKGLDVKCLVAPACKDVYLGKDSRIRHIRTASNIYAYGNIFFADMDITGDLVSEGHVFSWMSGITMKEGNLYAKKTVRSAGPVHALNGVIVADEGIQGEIKSIDIRALDVMVPGRDAPMALSQRRRMDAKLEQGRRILAAFT